MPHFTIPMILIVLELDQLITGRKEGLTSMNFQAVSVDKYAELSEV